MFFQWTDQWDFQLVPDLLSSGNKMWLKFTTYEYYSSNRNGFALSALSVPTMGMSLTCTYTAV